MFLLSDRCFVIPEMLYIGLLLLFCFLVVISIVAIVMGAMQKKKMKWFILWGSCAYFSHISRCNFRAWLDSGKYNARRIISPQDRRCES